MNGSTGGPVPSIHKDMLAKIMPMRDLIDDLGEYFPTQFRVETVEPIRAHVVGLNASLWPRCAHCGGDVSCADYEPDFGNQQAVRIAAKMGEA